jgi:hypothetical protein
MNLVDIGHVGGNLMITAQSAPHPFIRRAFSDRLYQAGLYLPLKFRTK